MVKLTTKRLILRPLRISDANDVVQNINNLEIVRWLGSVPYPYKKKDAIWFINDSKKKMKEKHKTHYQWGIELKSEKKIIGGISLDRINLFSKKSHTGYWLGENYWRKGYGLEALRAVLKFAFNNLKLRKIETGVFVGNPSSGKLLEKVGAKKEGILRKTIKVKADGQIYDEILYGLLKEEWKRW